MSKKITNQDDKKMGEEVYQNLLMNLTKIIKDTHSVSILTEVLINDTITVSELKDKPSIKNSMKKSLLYSRLKDLESLGFITSVYEVQTTEEDRGYAVKKYSISKDFINLTDQKFTEYSKQLPRETRLFGLYMIQSFLLREMDRILNSSNEEIKNNPNEIRGGYGGLITLNKEEFNFIQQRIGKLIAEAKEKFESSDISHKFQTYGLYYGFYYLPEKEGENS